MCGSTFEKYIPTQIGYIWIYISGLVKTFEEQTLTVTGFIFQDW